MKYPRGLVLALAFALCSCAYLPTSIPRISIPRIGIPKVSIPKIGIPKVSIPKISIPKVSIPRIGIPKPSSAAQSSPTPIIHVVQSGDTLAKLAKTYGTSVEAIASANSIADVNLIRVGQKLVIPVVPAVPSQATVASGESTPTRSPKASPTRTPVTAKSVTLTGSGDSILDFENPFEAALVHITGNDGARFFAVTNYGSNGESIGLLVNTTDPYDGVRLIDPESRQHTTRFEVSATGNWTIEVLPLSSARRLSVPGTIQGTGDDVVTLSGSTPDVATVKGNAAGRFFAVIGYGQYSDLLVNTTDPYEGTVRLNADTVLLEVMATGVWSIAVKAK